MPLPFKSPREDVVRERLPDETLLLGRAEQVERLRDFEPPADLDGLSASVLYGHVHKDQTRHNPCNDEVCGCARSAISVHSKCAHCHLEDKIAL